MTSVVTGAYEAVKLANKVTGAAEDKSIGKLEGTPVTHWSCYLLVAGSIIGAIAAVAAGVFGVMFLCAGGVILSVTNAVGAYYVKKFAPLKTLEGYVEVMTEQINEMSQQITRLHKINIELGGTADRLDQNLDETKEVWEHGYEQVKGEAEEIERLTKQLEMTTKKLLKVEEMYKSLQDALNVFSNGVSDLSQHRDDINEKVSELADKVKGAEVALDLINNENDEFDENNAIYDQLNKANLEFLDLLGNELKQFMELHKEAKQITDALEKQSDILTKVSDQIAESLKTIEGIESEENEAREEAKVLLNKTTKLTKALQSVVNEISKTQEAKV